jgi:hypothetical protein
MMPPYHRHKLAAVESLDSRHLRRAGLLAVPLGLAAALSANLAGAAVPRSLGSDSPTQIVAAAARAFAATKSVRIVGVLTSGATKESINISTLRNGDLAGSITSGGALVQIITVDKTTYLRASEAFWQRFGHLTAAEAAKIAPNWLSESSTKSLGSSFSVGSLAKSLGTNDGTLTNSGTGTVGGVKVIKVTSSKGGTLYVQDVGPTRVLELAGKAVEGGSATLRFTGYDAQPTPVAPPKSVPLSAISG